jgi:hypothetical protein
MPASAPASMMTVVSRDPAAGWYITPTSPPSRTSVRSRPSGIRRRRTRAVTGSAPAADALSSRSVGCRASTGPSNVGSSSGRIDQMRPIGSTPS